MQVCDARGGHHTSGNINLIGIESRGIYAYSENSELFNTAVINGAGLTSPIHSFQVSNWHGTMDSSIDGLIKCTTEGNALSATAEVTGCVVSIQKNHLEGAEKQEVVVEYSGEKSVVRILQPAKTHML